MINSLYVRRSGDDPEATILLQKLQHQGYSRLNDLKIEKVYRLEGSTPEQNRLLYPLFCNSSAEIISESTGLRSEDGPIIEVGYQRAVTDPELPSVLRGAEALGVKGLEWVRLAHRYQFTGIDPSEARSIMERYLYNPQVQVIIAEDETWDTLKPQGEAGPVLSIPLNDLSDAALNQLSHERRLFLSLPQMKALQDISNQLGRDLTDAEVEMFAQTWSDHCFHTTWKSLGLLQALGRATHEINHPLVISVFEDNAGAMEFYDGWALTLKGETHNSPTAVSPYGGIMTKHGGVIRDTLGCGQGAKPIGGSTVMGLGRPELDWNDLPRGALHPRTVLLESIRGTADYTNPMGIPMMFPVYKFHPGYTAKCFALGHSVGLIPAKRARKGHPHPGDLAILIGGLTGRDGLHGATVSSSSMTSETHVVDAAHVQIGHPIEERKFMEAIPVLRDRDCLRAVTDLGAAGLSSALGEMGADTGIWVNLARVPLKTEGMHPWEIWISESQERMLLCVPPGELAEALDILERYEVPAAVLGKFTSSGRCQVVFDQQEQGDPLTWTEIPALNGETVVDLDFTTLRKGCPLPEITVAEMEKGNDSARETPPDDQRSLSQAIADVLSHLNICDQSAAGFQFDKTVQGISAVEPYDGVDGNMPNDVWMATPLPGKPQAAVTSLAFNPLYGDIDPSGMAGLMIIEAITKQVAAGVSPEEIVLCDNFYTPRVDDKIAYHLTGMVQRCCHLSGLFGTPFISGKDSSSGTFIAEDGTRLDIPPTLAVLAMGRLHDVRRRIPKPWQDSGSALILAGPLTAELGGSIYLDTLRQPGRALPQPDPEEVNKFWRVYHRLAKNGTIKSAAALGEGGLCRLLFEMALGSGLGCSVSLDGLADHLNLANPRPILFAEMIGSILLEVDSGKAETLASELSGFVIGKVDNTAILRLNSSKETAEIPLRDLIRIWKKPFREVIS